MEAARTNIPFEPLPARIRWGAAAGVAVLALAVRLPWLTSPGFVIDQAQFVQWSEISRSPSEWSPPGGLSSVYLKKPGSTRPWCNYPPVYVYCLRGLAGLYDFLAPTDQVLDVEVAWQVIQAETTPSAKLAYALYKIPAVAADVVLTLLIFVLLVHRQPWMRAFTVAAMYALMPAAIHNSALWGQIDAIPTLLVIVSLELARRRRLMLMAAAATLALLTKAQAIMMAPVWIMIAVAWGGTKGRRWLAMLGTALGIVVIVLLPFRNVLGGVSQAYLGAANYYPFTHLNGFSAWFLKTPLIEPRLNEMAEWYVSDLGPGFLGIGLRYWGLIGVVAVWAYVMIVLRRRRCDDQTILWAARVLPLAFFLLSTQMHERYLFPAIAIWAWSFFHSRRWWMSWIAIGGCVTLNQLWVWPGPSDASWADTCRLVLHRPWLGMAPGIWCSFSLLVVFIYALIARTEAREETGDV